MWGGAGTGRGAPAPADARGAAGGAAPGGGAPPDRALGAGNGPGGRRCQRWGPAQPRCREGSRPAAGGVGGGEAGPAACWGEFSPGLACDSRPGPRPRGPGCPVETHRKGPDPHLGVLPAARAFAQIRHGARPLPGGGCGSHSEAPVSHLRRAGGRGATLGAAARPPVGLGSWPAPRRPRRGRRRLGLRRLGLRWGGGGLR